MTQPLLEVDNIHTYYGNIHALKGVSLTVKKGEIVTLIGANGAGKTTTLRTISGLLKPRVGSVRLEGEDLIGYNAHELVYKGVAMVPEGRGVFSKLTVAENLDMGAFSRRDNTKIRQDLNHVFELFPRLAERRRQVAGTLSGGEQQMLAMARALIQQPKLLLIDEMSMGLAPRIVETLFDTVHQTATNHNTTIILVEQHINLALNIAHQAAILNRGTIVLHDQTNQLHNQTKQLEHAYFGHTQPVT